jgi:hypothetical protein
MGLLDDAIREHLDLKRRRGADPAEVERAEREALGPVRRNPVPGEDAIPADQPPDEGGLAYNQDDDRDWAHESVPGVGSEAETGYLADHPEDDAGLDPLDAPPTFADEDRPRARPSSLSEPPPQAPAPSGDWSAADSDDPVEPFPTAPAPEARTSDLGGETTQFNVEEVFSAEDHAHGAHEAVGDGDDEDVLEETPEFLQDTPDHDRLWFEQRPPRDFDFDG